MTKAEAIVRENSMYINNVKAVLNDFEGFHALAEIFKYRAVYLQNVKLIKQARIKTK